MDQFSKEGRKLRPRKTAGSNPAKTSSERVEYHSERRSAPGGERKSYGGHKPYGEHRSFATSRPDGEHRPYGERRSYGVPRPDSENKPYGERKNFGDRKPYGERRGYGSSRPDADRKPYGEHKNFSDRKPYGARPEGDRKPYGERRSFGGPRKPSNGRGQNKYGFNKYSEEGISRMVDRRSFKDREQREFNDEPVQEMAKNEMRLNKFIANSGVCSRREADTLIQAGVVTVNGEVITELGTKVNIFDDDIRFNGERLKGEQKVYIVMNKPSGYVTTASDPHAEKTVLELLKGCNSRVYPVGRLDKNTTGVLMFTNDGEIAERLTHPSYDKKKIYQVVLDKPLEQADYESILSGITLADGDIKADELEYIDESDKRKLGIEIHSGKNRIIRRIFDSLGYEVKNLDRVYFAGLTKKGLKKGEWRYLSESEVNILKMGAYV